MRIGTRKAWTGTRSSSQTPPSVARRHRTTPSTQSFLKWSSVLASAVPETKLIYIVRDPLDRAASHYHHARCDDLESRSVEEAFAAHLGDNNFVRCGLYAYQLHRYLTRFSMDSIAIVDLTELKSSPRATLQNLYSFLGVSDPGGGAEPDFVLNRSAEKGRRSKLREDRIGHARQDPNQARPAKGSPRSD